MNTTNIDCGDCLESGCDGKLTAPTRRGMTAHPYVCDKCGKEYSHLKLSQDCLRVWNTGHPGSIYSTNQDGVPEAFARFQASEKALCERRMAMGKTRDGMSGHFGVTADRRKEQRATGLLAGLMRRI